MVVQPKCGMQCGKLCGEQCGMLCEEPCGTQCGELCGTQWEGRDGGSGGGVWTMANPGRHSGGAELSLTGSIQGFMQGKGMIRSEFRKIILEDITRLKLLLSSSSHSSQEIIEAQ